MGGEQCLEYLGDWPDHHDILLHLVHQDHLLADLLHEVGQHKITACAGFALALLVCAVGLHAVVDSPAVQAGPGVVNPVLRVAGEEVGDGGCDAALWAGE